MTNRNMRFYQLYFILICLHFFLILLVIPNPIFGQGLRFTGSDHPIEKRTSAIFFSNSDHIFHDGFAIKFDLQLTRNSTMGYIVRIQEENQSAIFNLHYTKDDNQAIFRLNEEGKNNLITMRIPLKLLNDRHWFPVHLEFELKKGQIKLQIADAEEQFANVSVVSSYAPNITFGRSDYMIDVPSFSLRNLCIGNQKNQILFPLQESTGDKIHSASGEVMGKVTNGFWLLNDAFHWQKHISMHSSTPSGGIYDSKRKSIYYFNQDTIQIYAIQTNETRVVRFPEPCPVQLKLGNSFIDENSDKLYVYETYYETTYTGPTVASLDLNDYSWTVESNDYLQHELNHHAAYFLPVDHKLLLFGGFGNMVYSNNFLFYDLAEKSWSAPESLRGDSILPRYFTSIGRSASNDNLYIFGGMGNESGQHIVGRKYFYDLHILDPVKKIMTKLWGLNWKESHFVPARGLVIPDTNWIYLLGYPEHLTHSFITLRRFSIHDGRYEELGDTIPIYSDKISTHANLYFDSQLNKLITLVQESDNDIRSTVTIYSLDFPAISEAQLHAFPSQNSPTNILTYIGLFGFLSGAISVYVLYLVKRKSKNSVPTIPLPEVKEREHTANNHIYLFGDFTVIDKGGMDISHLFSTQLQQVFCLILFHSHTVGISSNLLTNLLWPDKPKDKAKTSRGVAINSLRKVLNELNGVEIIYEDGHYRILVETNCYCDYWQLKELLANHVPILSPEIQQILKRGKFLLGMDDSIFDKPKHDMERVLTETLQQAIVVSREHKNWQSLWQAADLLIRVDGTNELALEQGIYACYKEKLEHRAILFYKHFANNYKQLMGEDYTYSFEDIWRRTVQ